MTVGARLLNSLPSRLSKLARCLTTALVTRCLGREIYALNGRSGGLVAQSIASATSFPMSVS